MRQRTVKMYLEQGEGKTIYTYAICPLHGKKYLTLITARQAMSKNQAYRQIAEDLFLRRAGTTREHVYFVWNV